MKYNFTNAHNILYLIGHDLSIHVIDVTTSCVRFSENATGKSRKFSLYFDFSDIMVVIFILYKIMLIVYIQSDFGKLI